MERLLAWLEYRSFNLFDIKTLLAHLVSRLLNQLRLAHLLQLVVRHRVDLVGPLDASPVALHLLELYLVGLAHIREN